MQNTDKKPFENKQEKKNFSKRNDKRQPRREKEVDPIASKLVDVNRVTKVVKGGRTMRFSALVVVGDKAGKVGLGQGKAAEVPNAIDKATSIAKKRMVTIALEGTTIPNAGTENKDGFKYYLKYYYINFQIDYFLYFDDNYGLIFFHINFLWFQ